MPREDLLDRVLRLHKRDLEASRRERKEWRQKLKALNEAQQRNEETIDTLYRARDVLVNSRADGAYRQADADEKLNAFIGAVERLVNERREGKP